MSPARPPAIGPAAFDSGSLTESLRQGVAELGIDLPAKALQRLVDYLALLARWNSVYNLTSVRDPQLMVATHLLDCIATMPELLAAIRSRPAPEILDVGSGPGLPGIVWAILLETGDRSDARISLIDAVEKKTAFQRQACAELGLRNVQCVHARVERWQSHPFDLIASRAYAALSDFVAGTAHLLAPQGCWFALKGVLPHDEIQALAPDIEVDRLVPVAVPRLQQAARCVVVLRRRPHAARPEPSPAA